MNALLVIEPNLRSPSGHYAEFVRALGSVSGKKVIQVYADPRADDLLSSMEGVVPFCREPRIGRFAAEWRTIVRAVREKAPFLVLTADARHAALLSLTAAGVGSSLGSARLFFHRAPTTVRDRFFAPLMGMARRHAIAVTATEQVAGELRQDGWRQVILVPYPMIPPPHPPEPLPFRHLLMAGAARINKGLDILSQLVCQWNGRGEKIPLFVQVSHKHAERHGRREGDVVKRLLSCGYPGLHADGSAPDREEYLSRFRGALVLAPYAREQFASQVSGIVLDALLNGAPVIATRKTWPGDMVDRFGAGVTIAERTPSALDEAIRAVLHDWGRYARAACHAGVILAREHDPRHLMDALIPGENR
ncbi:MAG: glycosyltransferase [Desulfuromonadia bacterium]